MPNKYGSPEPVYEKCRESSCGRLVRRMPHDLLLGTKKYCSAECKYKNANAPKKYAPEVISLIMEFGATHSSADFAAHLGVEIKLIRKFMSDLRRKGYAIPLEKAGSSKVYKVGDTKTRKDRGRSRQVILTEMGWRAIPNKTSLPVRTKRMPAGNKITSATRRPTIVREEPVEIKRKIEKNICVVINAKTQVFVSKLSDIPRVREKYKHLNQSIYTR